MGLFTRQSVGHGTGETHWTTPVSKPAPVMTNAANPLTLTALADTEQGLWTKFISGMGISLGVWVIASLIGWTIVDLFHWRMPDAVMVGIIVGPIVFCLVWFMIRFSNNGHHNHRGLALASRVGLSTVFISAVGLLMAAIVMWMITEQRLYESFDIIAAMIVAAFPALIVGFPRMRGASVGLSHSWTLRRLLYETEAILKIDVTGDGTIGNPDRSALDDVPIVQFGLGGRSAHDNDYLLSSPRQAGVKAQSKQPGGAPQLDELFSLGLPEVVDSQGHVSRETLPHPPASPPQRQAGVSTVGTQATVGHLPTSVAHAWVKHQQVAVLTEPFNQARQNGPYLLEHALDFLAILASQPEMLVRDNAIGSNLVIGPSHDRRLVTKDVHDDLKIGLFNIGIIDRPGKYYVYTPRNRRALLDELAHHTHIENRAL